MARTNATLLALQKKGSLSPNIPIYYDNTGQDRPSDAGGADNGGSWTQIEPISSVSRMVKIDPWWEGPFSARATCFLDNANETFNAYDLKGKWLKIGRGFGTQVSFPAYYKVRDDSFISTLDEDGGVNHYMFDCIGAWDMLKEYRNPEHLFFNQPGLDAGLDGYSGRDVISYVLSAAGLALGTDISLDSYIDVWEPEFTFPAGMTGADMVLEALSIFRCALLPRTDKMHILHLNTGDSCTYKIPSDGVNHPAKDAQKYNSQYSPMKVEVHDPTETYSGSYADSDWQSGMGYVSWPDCYNVVDSNGDATHIATAEVEKSKQRAVSGMINIWEADCLRELYDSATLVDGRGNAGQTDIVGGISCPYYPWQDWQMTLQLGGLYDENVSSTGSGGSSYSYGISGGIPGNQIIQNSIRATQIMANTITANEIAAETITGNEIAANTITAGLLNVVGIDASGRIVVADATDANEVTSGINNYASTKILPGKVLISGSTTLDYWSHGSDATYIDGGKIYTDSIEAAQLNVAGLNGSTGRIQVNDATDANEVTSGINSYAGTTINGSKITTGSIVAGHLSSTIILSSLIVVGSGTKDSTLNGWAIGYYGATSEIVGQSGGSDQVVLNTSGQVLAGAGAVIIDSNGITFKRTSDTPVLRFQDSGGTLRSSIYYAAAQAMVIDTTDKDFFIQSTGDIYLTGGAGVVICAKNFYPNPASTRYLGHSSAPWLKGYMDQLYTNTIDATVGALSISANTDITIFTDTDDISITAASAIGLHTGDVLTIDAGTYLDVDAATYIDIDAGTYISINSGTNYNVTITSGGSGDVAITAGGNLYLFSLPSSDPASVGAVYYDGSGYLKRSSG